jgi:hypothetical protein
MIEMVFGLFMLAVPFLFFHGIWYGAVTMLEPYSDATSKCVGICLGIVSVAGAAALGYGILSLRDPGVIAPVVYTVIGLLLFHAGSIIMTGRILRRDYRRTIPTNCPTCGKAR